MNFFPSRSEIRLAMKLQYYIVVYVVKHTDFEKSGGNDELNKVRLKRVYAGYNANFIARYAEFNCSCN